MSPDRKHGREAAHRRAAAQAAARELQRRRQQRLRAVIAGVVAAAVLLAIAFQFVGSDDDTPTATAPTSSLSTTTSVFDTSTTASISAGPFQYGTGECPPGDKPAEPVRQFADAPQKCIEDGKSYSAEVVTSEGTFTISLLADQAPGTVNNFVVLARYGYYDGLIFHRVVKGFMNQGGDPLGNGTGNPGYSIADELPTEPYQQGAVAMANSGPNTNGSQFFTCVECSSLPLSYSLFGRVTAGMDVVTKINDLGVADGPPSKQVTITSVTITEQ